MLCRMLERKVGKHLFMLSISAFDSLTAIFLYFIAIAATLLGFLDRLSLVDIASEVVAVYFRTTRRRSEATDYNAERRVELELNNNALTLALKDDELRGTQFCFYRLVIQVYM